MTASIALIVQSKQYLYERLFFGNKYAVLHINELLLFSAHISYGKGKYLNQTFFLQNLPRIIVYVI